MNFPGLSYDIGVITGPNVIAISEKAVTAALKPPDIEITKLSKSTAQPYRSYVTPP